MEFTTVTAEAVIDRAATALGLPPRDAEESLTSYAERLAALGITAAKKTETARCLGEAITAAKVAAHDEVAHWLRQAAKHIPTE
jgi:hypothetical protein